MCPSRKSKTQRSIKNETAIKVIARQVIADVKARGLDFYKNNSQDRRYAANYIVRRSAMAPVFQKLGITNGDVISRAFFDMPDLRFFKAIYWLYYLNEISDGEYTKAYGGADKVIKNGTKFIYIFDRISKEYYDLRRKLRDDLDLASGKKDMPQAGNTLAAILKRRLPVAEYINTYKGQICDGLFFLGFLFYGVALPQELIEYRDKYQGYLDHMFVTCGYYRSVLKQFHNLKLPTESDPVGSNIENANDSLITNVLGRSHEELNYMSTCFRKLTTQRLTLMERWELLEGSAIFDDEKAPDKEPEPITAEPEPEPMIPEQEDKEIFTTGSLTESSLHPEVLRLAQDLAKIHGPVKVAQEASGVQIYIANPELLKTDGMKELISLHLAINAERYLGVGRYDPVAYPTKENKRLYMIRSGDDLEYESPNRVKNDKNEKRMNEVVSAMCMKTRDIFSVRELLRYTPLSKRYNFGPDAAPNVLVVKNQHRLVVDEHGVEVPAWCGDTVPLSSLPANHPAIEYLISRNFSIPLLEQQFECCYCTKALDESRAEGIFYSRLPGGMKNSPQGRIIFSIRMNGSRVGYQSRYIDKWVNNNYYVWSDTQRWMLIKIKHPDGREEELYPPDPNSPLKHEKLGFKPHKYLNAVGSSRQALLMGFDAAVAYNATRPFNKRFCIIVEGPLDAARFGAPAIAILGRSISPNQAKLLRENFHTVLLVLDNDKAGQTVLKHAEHEQLNYTVVSLPDTVKDAGEMSYADAHNLILPYDPYNL